MNISELKKLIKDAIDSGATNLEQIHKAIAKLPLEYLEKIGPLEETAKSAQELADKTIGNVYEFIRKMNQKVDEIATELLEKVEKKKD